MLTAQISKNIPNQHIKIIHLFRLVKKNPVTDGYKNRSIRAKKSEAESGFTLIELLVVTMILGILASIAFALLNPAVLFGQARDTRRKADIREIAKALQLYYNDKKCYPNSNNGWVNITTFSGTTDLPNCINPLVPSYIKSLPGDPTSGRIYEYLEPNANNGCSDNQYFVLRAQLERTETPTAVWCDGTNAGINSTSYTYVTAN